MKIVTNLPAYLRVIFGFLRVMTIIAAAFWLLVLSYNTWIPKSFGPDRLMATVGKITLPIPPDSIGVSSDQATPGSLKLDSLQGTLQANLASNDHALVSALRRAIIPPMVALIVFAYVLFTALRQVCANLEHGEVFNAENLRLVRRIGVSLIIYNLLAIGLEVWASHVLHGYLWQHVTLTGLATSFPFKSAVEGPFELARGGAHAFDGILTGCLVLVVAEAFRQGLRLKTDNDLTV